MGQHPDPAQTTVRGRVSTNGLLTLGDVRARAGLALAPTVPGDPAVFESFVDSLDPPALLLMWGTPWVEPRSMVSGMTERRGYWQANLVVLMVAGRLEPGPGVDELEHLLGYTFQRLAIDSYTWPAPSSTPPRPWRIGGNNYLGATLEYRVPVTL